MSSRANHATSLPVGLGGERTDRGVAWGFVDQVFSSITNAGLILMGGRLLGPDGLGAISIAFAVYLIAFGVQRRLLLEPLVAASSSLSDQHRREVTDFVLTVSVTAGAALAAAVALAGFLVPGFTGTGLLIVAPWLVPLLVQDLCRHTLFRDKRARSATGNDAIWFVAMLLTALPVSIIQTDWAIVGWWGMAAAVAAVFGLRQTGILARNLKSSWTWVRREVLPFGTWNAGSAIVRQVGSNATTLVLAAILGSASLGGLRAAQTIFTPMTLVGPAILLPGLPILTRVSREQPETAKRFAAGLSAAAGAVTLAYIVAMALGAWRILPSLFGSEFLRFKELLWPIGVAQVFSAAGIGFLALLKSRRDGRRIVAAGAVGSFAGLCLVPVLAFRHGVEGAAWGSACSSALGFAVLALMSTSRRAIEAPGSRVSPDEEVPVEARR